MPRVELRPTEGSSPVPAPAPTVACRQVHAIRRQGDGGDVGLRLVLCQLLGLGHGVSFGVVVAPVACVAVMATAAARVLVLAGALAVSVAVVRPPAVMLELGHAVQLGELPAGRDVPQVHAAACTGGGAGGKHACTRNGAMTAFAGCKI